MKNGKTLATAVLMATLAFSAGAVARFAAQEPSRDPAASAPARARATSGSTQQFPIVDALADKIIQKYQGSSCEQLAQQRSDRQGQPKSPQEQQAMNAMRSNPEMRTAFINKVAAPIANKMFDCGMIP
jgi:hypothetical protein